MAANGGYRGANGGAQPSPAASTPRGRRAPIWDVAESIDYVPRTNSLALARQDGVPERQRYGYTGSTAVKLGTTLLCAILIGCTAALLEVSIETAVQRRNAMLHRVLLRNFPLAVGWQLLASVAAVTATGVAVQLLAPGAAGAGVSLVMALLNGNNISGLLTPAVFVVKLAGTTLSRFAALSLGPEAPMVHLGACVASILCGLERKLWRRAQKRAEPATELGSDSKRSEPVFDNNGHREMVSAGVAAGMAAAFGAPIGGVLFALEEACSVWSRKTAWRCLLCSAVAVFTISQLSPSGAGLLLLRGVYPLSPRQWLWQLPFVVAVSAGGALLGATFNLLRKRVQSVRVARTSHTLRILEAAGVAAVTVAATTLLSYKVGRCLEVPPTWDAAAVVQYTCATGQYNDLATLLFGGSPWVIRSLLALGSATEPLNSLCTLSLPCYFSALSLGVLCLCYLALMCLSSGLTVPGGLFMPSILVGASGGAAAGLLLSQLLPPSWDIQPGVYALVGATATLGAVFRTSLALTVIVVEGTRGIDLLPGILAAVIVSNFVAHAVHPHGVYESELERDGRVFFLKTEPPGVLRWRSAGSIMASPVVSLPGIVEVGKVLDTLKYTTHNGFPVHHVPGPSGVGGEPPRLDGFILRSQLLVLLQEQAVCDAQGRYLRPPPDARAHAARLNSLMLAATASADGLGGVSELGVDPLMQQRSMAPEAELTFPLLDSLPSVTLGQPGSMQPPARGSASVSFRPADNQVYLNLEPFMHRAMLSVRPLTPAMTAYQLFMALSLRHLCVVDSDSRVVGILTRKDLDHASGEGWWRTNRIAPTPHHTQSQSWLTQSLAALTMPPRRALSDLWQRMRLSPRGSAVLGSSDEGGSPCERLVHSDSEAGPMGRAASRRNGTRLQHDGDEEQAFLAAFGSTAFHD